MDQNPSEAWTVERVEARLVSAFEVLPGAPIYSTGSRLQTGVLGGSDILTDTLSWGTRFVPDREERLALLTWARCRSQRLSFSEQCELRDWNRSTAERARRRAAARVATCLNLEQLKLDNGKTGSGASIPRDEAAPDLATA